MASVLVLLVVLGVGALVPCDELVRRGYELLPDARWREELERDEEKTFLGAVLEQPALSDPSLLLPDVDLLDYDRRTLYPADARIARVNLGLRPWSHWWNKDTTPLFPTTQRFPHEPYFMK